MSRIRVAGAALAVAGLSLAVPPAASARVDGAGSPTASASQARPIITMSGSTSVAPLAARLARGYLRQYPRRVRFRLAQGGSDVGVQDVAAGRVSIGNSSRDPRPGDPGGIFFNRVARDALCVVTNSANRIPDLSQATVQGIFTGQIRDWSQVPGSPVQGAINVNVRTPASGTQDSFDNLFLNRRPVFSGAQARASSGLVQSAVRSDRNAIGYVSLAFASGLSTPAYRGVGCTLRDARSGSYLGARNFWMVTRGRPTGATARWIQWIQQSRRASRVIATEWVPLQ